MKTRPLTVLFDSREQTVPPFPDYVTLLRATLSEGDYTSEKLQGIAVVERKSPQDWAGTITRGRERFDDEVRRLAGYRWKCVVVEGALDETYFRSKVHPHSVIGTVASLAARHDIPTFFLDSAENAGLFIAGWLRRLEERVAGERDELLTDWEATT